MLPMLPPKPLAWIFVAAAVLGLFPGPARAAAPAKKRTAATTRGRLHIAIDPVTHRPVAPTPDQIRAWNTRHAMDALRAPARPLAVQKLRGGGEIVHLNGSFRSFAVARVGPDGKVVTDCAPDPASARKILATPAAGSK
jgi:hypothetical protein